jgi:hypothetical protein
MALADPPSHPIHLLPQAVRFLLSALALSLGIAVSRGITRFSCGFLLPLVRDDLGWSFTLAGAMNSANLVGYLSDVLAMS